MRVLVLIEASATADTVPVLEINPDSRLIIRLQAYASAIVEKMTQKLGETLVPEFRFVEKSQDDLMGSEVADLLSPAAAKDLIEQAKMPVLVISPHREFLKNFPAAKCTKLQVAKTGDLQGLHTLSLHESKRVFLFKKSDSDKPLTVYCDIDKSVLMSLETWETGELVLNQNLIEYFQILGRRFPEAFFQLITTREEKLEDFPGSAAIGVEAVRVAKFADNIKAKRVLEQLKPTLEAAGFRVAPEVLFTNKQRKLILINQCTAPNSQFILVDDNQNEFFDVSVKASLQALQAKGCTVFILPIASQGHLLAGPLTAGPLQTFKEKCAAARVLSELGKRGRSDSGEESAKKKPNLFQNSEEEAALLLSLCGSKLELKK